MGSTSTTFSVRPAIDTNLVGMAPSTSWDVILLDGSSELCPEERVMGCFSGMSRTFRQRKHTGTTRGGEDRHAAPYKATAKVPCPSFVRMRRCNWQGL